MTDIEWRPVVGYEGLYEVSNAGDVRSVSLLPGPRKQCDVGGYRYINLRKDRKQKMHKAHRLVAFAFLGEPPPGREMVNHKNGNRADNRVENLEWVSCGENIRHAWHVLGCGINHKGASLKGTANPRAKISDADVIDIRHAHRLGRTPTVLAAEYGLSPGTIQNIVGFRAWKHISPSPSLRGG